MLKSRMTANKHITRNAAPVQKQVTVSAELAAQDYDIRKNDHEALKVFQKPLGSYT